MIRPAQPKDSLAISEIYNHYVLHTVVTFEEEPVTPGEMEQRVIEMQRKHSWLVWEENGNVIGYAYGGPWKVRAAYRHATELSVYMHPHHTGKGIGPQLYHAIIKEMQALNMHALIGGVALPNDASIKLHESLGFTKIAQFREVGWKLGRWVDVAYWELVAGE